MTSRSYPSDQQIWELAKSQGLDPFPVHCEAVPANVLYEFAAYLIPGRMSHWSYGKAYHAMKTRYDYGLNKLYEMVINADPAYAFLLDSNSNLENTFVRAHVMGHVDFFRNNVHFSPTQRDMLEVVSRHAERARQYEFDYGKPEVEALLDATLAIQEHVVPPTPTLKPRETARLTPRNDPEWNRLWQSETAARSYEVRPHDSGDRDVLRYIITHSDQLEDWQRDIVGMVRDEMLYFWPQMRTKIMNEGWDSYWHLRLMRCLDLDDADVINYSRLHASVTAPISFQINPYAIGYAIFRDLAEREGDDAIFLVRSMNDDVSFIRNYLTESLVDDLHLYLYGAERDQIVVKTRRWQEVRNQLVTSLVHAGIPVIEVEDGDFHHRGELYLIHRHEGIDLDLPYAERTLQHVHTLWGRPVHLETQSAERRLVLSYDGQAHTKATL